MDQVNFSLILKLALFLVFSTANGETTQVRDALVQFMRKLSPGNNQRLQNWGWNTTSDPCNDSWKGVTCYTSSSTVKKIVLDELDLTGPLDASSLCAAKALAVLSLNSNNIVGALPEDISKCARLTHIYLHGNNFSANLPGSLSMLRNLKRVDLSDNGFSGGIPDMSRITGLLTFLAENNHLSGGIPDFDFSNLEEFNVSNNNLSGPVPDGGARFNDSSFLGNPGLCGKPFSSSCPPPHPDKKKGSSRKDTFIYSGYALLGLIIVSLLALKLIKKVKPKKNSTEGFQTDSKHDKMSGSSSGSKKRSEFSITSAESGRASSSLVVLSSPVVNVIRFEDLLRSPAELIGRGRNGSLYKVTLNDGVMTLAVKRIRDWDISRDDFKKRMQRINQVRHPNVMPIVAFYSSRQEKLLVYEFQENGSLFRLLHGSQNGKSFDWLSRLTVASKISEVLAFMHEGLEADRIPHGNLKSSNILLSNQMEPLISEYGLAQVDHEMSQDGLDQSDQSFQENTNSSPSNDPFKMDTYSLGIILLELLTGKLVHNHGYELARWVNVAIREEWTVEVFDKGLVSEGAGEENMVNLLQVALKCINTSSEARPTIREVAGMISLIKESEERSQSESHD